ncbi:hypothetical protein MASR1M107_12890 [Ignavibacteriales bacterium]
MRIDEILMNILLLWFNIVFLKLKYKYSEFGGGKLSALLMTPKEIKITGP